MGGKGSKPNRAPLSLNTGAGAGALHVAVVQGNAATVRRLCASSSTDVNREADGLTPLMIAIADQIGIDVFRELLQCPRLDINRATQDDKLTPLMIAVVFAAQPNSKTIILRKIEMLAAHPQCQLGLRNSDDMTALELAVGTGNAAIIGYLTRGDRIKQYAQGDVLNACILAFRNGNNELIRAVLENVPEAIQRLLLEAIKEAAEGKKESESTDDNHLKDTLNNLAPLHLAVLRESVTDVKQILRQSSTDVNAKVAGLTPLMLAACGRNPVVMQLLLESPRIDVNSVAAGFKNMTALMMSVFACGGISEPPRISIVNLILAHPKCDFTYKNDEGLSALSMASIFGNTAAADCLTREHRADKYAVEDFSRSVFLAIVTDNKDLGIYMCSKLSELKQGELLKKLQNFDKEATAKATMAKVISGHAETAKRLSFTVKFLRLGKMAAGKFVEISDNESLVRKKQAEHNLRYLPNMCSSHGVVEKVLPNGDVEINPFSLPGTLICHADIITIDSRDYEAIDGSGETIKREDVVKVMPDYDTVAELQKGHGGMGDRMRVALGKTVRILFFDVDGDARIILGKGILCLNPRALCKVTTAICGDGSSVKIGDKVRVMHTASILKGLQTEEFGGWSDSMSELIGRTLTIVKFACSTQSEDAKCILKVEGGSRTYHINPKAVGLTDLATEAYSDTPTIRPRLSSEEGRSANPPSQSPSAGADLQIIQKKELKLEKKLGSGGFGTVFLAKWSATQCAVKKIAVPDLIEGEERKRILEEARIHNRLIHPHVVQFLGIALEEADVYLVLKVIHGYNLDEIIFENKMELTGQEKHTIAMQIADVMRYFHDNAKVIHQDMKPSNVLVDKVSKQAYVTDFGISRMSGRSTNDIIQETTKRYASELSGTIFYMAPELFVTSSRGDDKFRMPNRESDVYALGMTLVEFLGGVKFYDAPDIVTLIKLKTSADVPPSIRRVPSAYRVILGKCVDPNPIQRPSAQAVAEYFLKSET
ncbi:uncharacterized protein LOC129592586 isoform X2 [Paramacrobiotus metropolitanus]|uniref:uncharacterized protein LOC129592586 isoform X2 n=1 Tax=Paramacrobiotus metropolitanus TaxID=2943436 RepID=UPI002445CBDC|nr:uncharacterized protein LOC129592586 isoform X2 [Paramacrobiotus metropolitanus]